MVFRFERKLSVLISSNFFSVYPLDFLDTFSPDGFFLMTEVRLRGDFEKTSSVLIVSTSMVSLKKLLKEGLGNSMVVFLSFSLEGV